MNNKQAWKIDPVGDTAVRIQFGTEISLETNQKIRSFTLLLEKENIHGVMEWITTYTAVTLFYDPYIILYNSLVENVLGIMKKLENVELPPVELIYIPTYYGGEAGPDLEKVAEHNEIEVEDVIRIHTEKEYLIFMMGFTPGFPYLGGMSNEIATPRLETPRGKIPPGSVGIAGEQTGIYSIETPGGWNLIGRTPLRLYDSSNASPMLLQAGNYLKFVSISKEEYEDIQASVQLGTYQLEKVKMKS